MHQRTLARPAHTGDDDKPPERKFDGDIFQVVDSGIAQGGLVDMPDGRWFAYLFRDYGSVGRIPYLVPVTWKDGWPVLGIDGKVPQTLDLPAGKGLIPGIVNSDEFKRKKGEPALPPVW